MDEIRNILSKKISLCIIALLIGVVAIVYNLKGKNVFPSKSTIKTKNQNNNGLKIYDDTISITKDTLIEEDFPTKKLPI